MKQNASKKPHSNGSESQIQKFGTVENRPISLDNMVTLIEEAMGKRAVRHYTGHAVGDMAVTCADIAKAEGILGYRPTTTIAEGIRRFVAWARQQNAFTPRNSVSGPPVTA